MQKQHAEEQERQLTAQRILDEASARIEQVYQSRKHYRDPIEESRQRVKNLQRRAISTGEDPLMTSFKASATSRSASMAGSSHHQLPSSQAQQDYVTKEVTVRHLNDHANLNPTAFKLYRKLRFG